MSNAQKLIMVLADIILAVRKEANQTIKYRRQFVAQEAILDSSLQKELNKISVWVKLITLRQPWTKERRMNSVFLSRMCFMCLRRGFACSLSFAAFQLLKPPRIGNDCESQHTRMSLIPFNPSIFSVSFSSIPLFCKDFRRWHHRLLAKSLEAAEHCTNKCFESCDVFHTWQH